MNDPRRLLDEGADEFELRMLRSVRSDVASDQGLKRALVAMGVGVASVAAGSAAVAATKTAANIAEAGTGAAGAAGGAGAAGTTSTTAVGLLTLAKWTGVSVLAVSATVASVRAIQNTDRQDSVSLPASSQVTQDAIGIASGSAVAPTLALSVESIEVAAAASVASGSAVTKTPVADPPAPPSPSVARESSLPAEVAMLVRARSQLAQGNGRRAMAELNEYDRQYPSGMLAHEALVLRVQAMAQAGDSAGAMGLAKRFLAAHPNSPHASRLKELLPGVTTP